MLMIVGIRGHELNNYEVYAAQKKQLYGKRGFNDKIDWLITGVKGSGLMSPKLRLLTKATRAKTPSYEFNPSLFRNKERGSHE
jgi:hypothetical protein